METLHIHKIYKFRNSLNIEVQNFEKIKG